MDTVLAPAALVYFRDANSMAGGDGGRKRKFDTFSAASSGRADWMCDASVKMAFLEQVLPPPEKQPRILIPGIANSELGALMLDGGYDQVFACDFSESEVSAENQRLFPSERIRYFDLLDPKMPPPPDWVGSFDFVIDSSVTDVFMQITTQVKRIDTATASRVHDKLLSLLKKDGKMVVFSMNLQPWESIYGGKRGKRGRQMDRKHATVTPVLEIRTSRGRLTSMPQQDMHVLVASSQRLGSLPQVTIADKRYASRVSEWQDSTADLDWTSERS